MPRLFSYTVYMWITSVVKGYFLNVWENANVDGTYP